MIYYWCYWTSSNPDTEYFPFVITLTLLVLGFWDSTTSSNFVLVCHILYTLEIPKFSPLHWDNFYPLSDISLYLKPSFYSSSLWTQLFFTLHNRKVLFLHLNNGYEIILHFVADQSSVSFSSFQNYTLCFPRRCYRLFLRLFLLVTDRFKWQHSLASIWIRHPKYLAALDLDP